MMPCIMTIDGRSEIAAVLHLLDDVDVNASDRSGKRPVPTFEIFPWCLSLKWFI